MNQQTDIFESLQGYSLMETIGFERLPENNGLDFGEELKLLGLLGEGGMGVVHEALQTPMNRHVAVKKLKD